MQKQPELIHR